MLGPVEHEVPSLAPVVEEELAEAGPLDALQELLRDDLVGVDVRHRERREAAPDRADRLHRTAREPASSRTSVKWPAMAAAAAIGGPTQRGGAPGPPRPPQVRVAGGGPRAARVAV